MHWMATRTSPICTQGSLGEMGKAENSAAHSDHRYCCRLSLSRCRSASGNDDPHLLFVVSERIFRDRISACDRLDLLASQQESIHAVAIAMNADW
jgi:hypothetical protein